MDYGQATDHGCSQAYGARRGKTGINHIKGNIRIAQLADHLF